MQKFEGDRDYPLPPAELFAKLTDPRFLVQCLPDVETVRGSDADHAEIVLRPSFAFVRGTLDMTMRVTDRNAPTSAHLHVTTKGIGSASAVAASLALTPTDAGTRVHWVAEIKELGGLLKMIPSGLIRGAAQKVIGDAWNMIDAKLTPGQ